MSEFLDVCQQAARAGGAILMEMRGRVHPQKKGPKDFVTEADFASQEKIREILLGAFPTHRFVGEEDPHALPNFAQASSSESPDYCWVVDPLDGTMNYVHQLPNYSVSVALCHGSDVIVGVVFDPVLDECFSAERGCGANCNRQQITTSSCSQVGEALIAASLAAELPKDSPEVKRFIEVMHYSQAIRRLGSAALNLCYVASGRMDGYWATCVKAWDVAAGQLILREAGGTITSPDGSDFDLNHPNFVAAATTDLHRELRCVLERAI